jgi:hypothetical protein
MLPKLLSERIRLNEAAQLTYDQFVITRSEFRFHQCLDDSEALVLQLASGSLGEVEFAEVGERVASPLCESVSETFGRSGRVAKCQELATTLGVAAESLHIRVGHGYAEPIPAGHRFHCRLSQSVAETRNGNMKRRLGILDFIIGPEGVDYPIGGHRIRGTKGQESKQSTRSGTSNLDRDLVDPGYLQASK